MVKVCGASVSLQELSSVTEGDKIMYSVLIVDDEKMIRDDVYGLLSMEESPELDLATASSA